ncbi:MAG: M64 family metallopeptidase, partial [Bacteroidales bacterium]|nr:M64 family metallopeptidase [Bacteroidales bacterium]
PVPTPPKKKYLNKTGVFEGGGYAAKGVYRPANDCLMNTFNGDKFCDVCKSAIEKMILFYSK